MLMSSITIDDTPLLDSAIAATVVVAAAAVVVDVDLARALVPDDLMAPADFDILITCTLGLRLRLF